jgi:hypothetical protein
MSSETMFLEGVPLKDLQSQSPEVRVKALESLYRNACKVYGETSSVTEAERLRLEDARSALAQNSVGTGKTNI